MTHDHSKSKQDARNGLTTVTAIARDLVDLLRLGETCDLDRAQLAEYEELMQREGVDLNRTADILDTLENLAREIAEAIIDACAWDDHDSPGHPDNHDPSSGSS
jgi:hypothetical protein